MNQTSEIAREAARRAADAARETANQVAGVAKDVRIELEEVAVHATDATKDAAKYVAGMAKDIYHSAAVKAEDTLTTSKDYVRRNPVPVVLGAIAFGAALGYMMVMSRRKPTFGERYVDEPLGAVRDAIFGTFAPVAQRVHEGYDSARNGAGKAMDRLHHMGTRRTNHSLSNQIGRIGNNLKFW